MFNTIKKIAIGASVLASVSTFSAPTFAASLTSVTTSGAITVFGETAGTTYQMGSHTQQDLINALGGTATAAGGNVELNNGIDYGWNNGTPSTLTANFEDQTSIIFGSLNQDDWFTGGLATTWYNAAYATYTSQFNSIATAVNTQAAQAVYNQAYNTALNSLAQAAYTQAYNATPGTVTQKTTAGNAAKTAALNSTTVKAQAATVANTAKSQYQATNSYNATDASQMVSVLETMKVFQRLSDPNIAYIQGDSGEFTFGLAGHSTLASGLQMSTSDPFYSLFSTMSASEVVKYSLDGGSSWQYAYSFGQPQNSGVINTDGFSHTGTYQFTVGTRSVDVPEPSSLIGFAAVSSLIAASKRRKKA